MIVVFDSNILLRSDGAATNGKTPKMPLSGSNVFWSELKEYRKRRHCQIAVPEVVLLEIANKVWKYDTENYSRLQKALRDFGNGIDWMHNRGFEAFAEGVDIQQLAAHAKSITIAQPTPDEHRKLRVVPALEDLLGADIEILPIPAVPHSDIIERCLSAKRPFGNNERDKGYRDYLIWHSLIELSRRQQFSAVVFISNNTHDFANSTGTMLHEDLLDELSVGNPKAKIDYFKSIEEFHKAITRPALSADAKWLSKLQLPAEQAKLQAVMTQKAAPEQIKTIDDWLNENIEKQPYSKLEFELARPPRVLGIDKAFELGGDILAIGKVSILIKYRRITQSFVDSEDIRSNDRFLAFVGECHYLIDAKDPDDNAFSIGIVEEDRVRSGILTITTAADNSSRKISCVIYDEWLKGQQQGPRAFKINAVPFEDPVSFRECLEDFGVDPDAAFPREALIGEEKQAVIDVSPAPEAIIQKWKHLTEHTEMHPEPPAHAESDSSVIH